MVVDVMVAFVASDISTKMLDVLELLLYEDLKSETLCSCDS